MKNVGDRRAKEVKLEVVINCFFNINRLFYNMEYIENAEA